MKKKLFAMMLILGLVIYQLPGAGVITASAAGARNYLAATEGGSIQWAEVTDGDGKIGTVSGGKQIEFADYYELPEGSSVEMWAVPTFPNRFAGWYTNWNSTEPVLVSSEQVYTWTLPTESGTTLTAVFSAPLPSALALGVTSGGSVSGSATDAYGTPKPFNGADIYYFTSNAEITLTAAPENDFTFKGWYSGTVDSSGSVAGNDGTLVSSANPYTFTVAEGNGTALQAVFEPATTVLTPIPAVTVNVLPPLTGSSASNALSGVSVPADEHYSLVPYVAVYATEPVFDNLGNPVTEPFTGNFEEDKTYYMGIALQADPGYTFQQGGGSYANTTVAVNGATLLYGSDLWISNMITDSGYESYGNILISFTPVPSDMWIDNCIDNSKSYITGTVILTGTGGTQAGYSEGQTVYSESVNVTYSQPKPAEVQAHIDAAYNAANNAANTCKNNGKSGEFDMSTTESTGRVWDNRAYKTYEYNSATTQWEYNDGKGNTEIYNAPAGTDPRTKIHVASGDYGKETYYNVAANGWVDGYYIAVTCDGSGTASADLETSLAGETVTLSATPSSTCYTFKEWQVVSGGAEPTDKTAASTTFTMPGSDVEIKAVFEPAHTLDKTEKVEATCTEPGTEAYWTCSVCHQMFSDEAGTTTITAPVVIPAGHNWGEWTLVKEATETEDGEEARTCGRCEEKETRVIPKLVVEYRNTEGDGSEWKKGSDGSLTFVFKRSENDEVTFSHFTGIKMDGTDVAAANYDAVSGSVKITLKPGYLETLSPGKHSITAVFNDADPAAAGFTVTTPTATPTPTTAPRTPNTGDNNSLWIWGVLFAAALAGLFAAVNKRSRNSR